MRYLPGILLAFFLLILNPAIAESATGIGMLPAGGKYDADIPQPKELLGFEVGEQHIRHDQLTQYFRLLAESSDRVQLQTIGRTHEGREQLLAVISSPRNLARIDEIRERHLAIANGDGTPGENPVILWQGYSVHGDESSGSNAVPLYAWHLAASEDEKVLEMLDDVVVLIDPSLNPDGMARFESWATSRRSQSVVMDPAHQEHEQPWPGGRGNHYWFDLNRDWMLLQHPESRARVNVLNQWRPHVVTDHHEMGANTTYFFQPGVPDRTHPLTPPLNQEMTGRIGEYHAKHLDAAGQFYYTKEGFDDFYYGKGSTYPDITGGIGILFEQATTRGQAIDTPYGERVFADSVRNQLITSFSTLEAAYELRDDLRRYQAEFFREARSKASGAWVIDDADNPTRMREFLSILAGHGIRFRPLTEAVQRDGSEYRPGHAWVVPMQQPQARLIEAMFETRTDFSSNVFYDVSTWTLPLAFDLRFTRLRSVPAVGEWHDEAPRTQQQFRPELNAVAYAFQWQDDSAPVLLQRLLADDIKVLAATKPLTVRTANGEVALERGSMVIPVGMQPERRGNIVRALASAARDHGIELHAVRSGLAIKGSDLGSRYLRPLKPVKPLLVTGNGVNSLEAGEVWHATDTRLGLPLTHVDRNRLASVNLADYTHVILVDGRYDDWGEDQASMLYRWMSRGGVLLAHQGAAEWAGEFGLNLVSSAREGALLEAEGDLRSAARKEKAESGEEKEQRERAAYGDFEDHYAQTLVSGTIFEADADLTHPLAFGLPDRRLPVFKSRAASLPLSDNPYATVLQFTDEPLMSGFVSDTRLGEIAGSGVLLADRVGEGLLIRSAIDPVFRAYWHGTQRLFVNSLYLAQTVRSTEMN